MKTLAELYELWDKLGDVPVVEDNSVQVIDEPFLHFDPGSETEEIWHWFEEQNPNFICGEVMQGIRRKDKRTFRVYYQITGSAYADIEAETVEEAMRKAEEMGGEDFKETDDRVWELDTDLTVQESEKANET